MRRNCDGCGREYEATRSDSRMCGSTCRNNKRRRRGLVPDSETPDGPPPDTLLVKATRAELEAAGQVDTMLGQLALALAARLKSEMTGASALSKELRAVITEACGATGPAPVADDIDELRARRDAKRVG